MATSNLKSAGITKLDTTNPPGDRGNSGSVRPGHMRVVSDFVTAANGDSTSSTYKLVRIPTTAYVKKVLIRSSIASAGSGDINVVFSDATDDGTSPANQGTIPQISSANNKLFGAAQSLVLSGADTDFTYANTTNFPAGSTEKQLWDVLGFTADPGGFFDIQINITTQVTTGGTVYCTVYYVD